MLLLQGDHGVGSTLELRSIRGRGYAPVGILLTSSHVGAETPLDGSVPYCENERRCVFRGPIGPASTDGYIVTIPPDAPAALSSAGHGITLRAQALSFDRRMQVTVTLARPGQPVSLATVAFLGADS